MSVYIPYREALYVLRQDSLPRPWAVIYHERVIRDKYPDVLFYTSYVLQDKHTSEYLIVVNYRTKFAYQYPRIGYDGREYFNPRDFRRQVGFQSGKILLAPRYLQVPLDTLQ